jgi:thiamine biosynthesis protein ThiS
MNIILNGKNVEVKNDCNIQLLLQELNFTKQRLAVEVNTEIIPRSKFDVYILKNNDNIEIVRAVGGG